MYRSQICPDRAIATATTTPYPPPLMLPHLTRDEREQTRGVAYTATVRRGARSLACVALRKARWGEPRLAQNRPVGTGTGASQTGNPSISRWQTAIAAGCSTSMWIRYTETGSIGWPITFAIETIEKLFKREKKTFEKWLGLIRYQLQCALVAENQLKLR